MFFASATLAHGQYGEENGEENQYGEANQADESDETSRYDYNDDYGNYHATPQGSLLKNVDPKTAPPKNATLRRPVALQLSSDGQTLYVANQQSGTISVISTEKGIVTGEFKIGQALASLVWLVPDRFLVATDVKRHELIVVEIQESKVKVTERLLVAPYPVEIAIAEKGKVAYISSLWTRRLTAIEFVGTKPRIDWTLDLQIAPRDLLPVESENKLIVADSFSGELLIVDTNEHKALGVSEVPGHNIRGLAKDDSGRLIVAHQMLNELAHTVRNDVHWGLLMSNDLKWFQLDVVLERRKNIYERSRMHSLGEPGRAASDPSGVTYSEAGMVVVTLGGVGEIAFGKYADFSLQRVRVGRRPVDAVIDDKQSLAYVANMFSESVSVVDLKTRHVRQHISLGATRYLTLAEKGELLFHDGRLSHDSWMSCNSCHPNGHTNGMLNDNFSDGSFGAPKRILSLLGKAGTEPLAWSATTDSFEIQVRNSILKTMQGDRQPTNEEVLALTAFVKSLPAPPSVNALREAADPDSIERGREIFKQRRCSSCHTEPFYTSPRTYAVGLEDELGVAKFNPPSLRGLSQRRLYFHDNRAASLEDVFVVHKHRMNEPIADEKLRDLLAFLRSL
ncbi:MAG: YVTN family beta-propeller protein [Pirellulaceae bacterium]|jgi:YVTN family beta-propeller protein